MKTLRSREDTQDTDHCIVDLEEISTGHDGWNITNHPKHSDCTQALCTQHPQTFVDIKQISSQGTSFSLSGYWFHGFIFNPFPPPKDNPPFGVQVDGETQDIFHEPSTYDTIHNTFTITVGLPNKDAGRAFKFTNFQSTTPICLVTARFTSSQGIGTGTISSSVARPSTPPVSTKPPSSTAPPSSVNGGTSSTAIAVAVVIPILTVLCLIFLTVYLRRRWRHRKVSVPATSERLGLDEPNMAERGSTLKTWSPTQSPFFSEMPIPRQIPHPTRARGEQRHFATFTLSSVSSIPQPPASVNPPSTQSSRSSIFDRAQVTFERLKTVRRTAPDPRRGVLRAVNASDE